MSTKIGRNDKCHCGSGLKYKRCCNEKDLAKRQKLIPQMGKKQKERNQWVENVSNRPFSAVIKSENGTSSSMRISATSITKNGITTQLLKF